MVERRKIPQVPKEADLVAVVGAALHLLTSSIQRGYVEMPGGRCGRRTYGDPKGHWGFRVEERAKDNDVPAATHAASGI